jgi:hypothetical protein
MKLKFIFCLGKLENESSLTRKTMVKFMNNLTRVDVDEEKVDISFYYKKIIRIVVFIAFYVVSHFDHKL